MPNTHDERGNTLRSPLLNRLTMVTLLTIVVAIGYLIGYYVRGAMFNSTTWYHAPYACSPFKAPCSVALGQAGHMVMQFTRDEHHQLNVQVDPGTFPATRLSAIVEHREFSSESRTVVLAKQADGLYHAERIALACTYPESRWRISIVAEAPERTLGTWYDFDEKC